MAAYEPSKHFFKFISPGFLFNLSIPKSFLTKLNGWRCKKKAILRRGSHKWAVDINSEGGVFGEGWRKFVRDNGVQELDFIVFKHLGNMVFEFHVFDQSTCERHYYYPPENQSAVTKSTADSLDTHRHKRFKRTAENYLNERKDDGCSFIKVLTPYCIKQARLHVPVNFATANGLFNNVGNTHIVIMDETQRSWTAKLIRNRTTEIHLTGWRKLVQANHLKSGDDVKFELVKSGKVPLYKFYKLGKKPTNKDMQVRKKTGSTTRYKATSSTHRYFISTLKPWSIKTSHLHLPNEFSRKNGLFQKEEMILKNVKGSSWTVGIKKFKNKFCYIRQGWKAFCVANKLREGEEFKLELVSNIGEIPVAYFYSPNIR